MDKQKKVDATIDYIRKNTADYGPVSIPIAEMIIRETEHQINMDAARKRESKKARMRNEQQG